MRPVNSITVLTRRPHRLRFGRCCLLRRFIASDNNGDADNYRIIPRAARVLSEQRENYFVN